MTIAKNGIFIDTRDGKIVHEQPEEGVQLVAPGAEVTDAAQRQIDAAELALAPVETATAVDADDEEKAKTVTSKAASRKG